MSHFRFQQVKFKPEVLMETLQGLGYSPIWNPAGQLLKTRWNDRNQPQTAHLIIPCSDLRNRVCPGRGDAEIGFVLNPETGMLETIIKDDWELMGYRPIYEGSENIVQDIAISYVSKMVEKAQSIPALKGRITQTRIVGSRMEVDLKKKPQQIIRR